VGPEGHLVDNVKRAIKPTGHFFKNRRTEIILGIALFLVGALLLFDAFDARGKKIPWPASAVTPW
jgi:hypothetical protein